MSDEDYIEIVVHGDRCPMFKQPNTLGEWRAIELIQDETTEEDDRLSPGTRVFRCPACKQVVYEMWDSGEIEFGT